MRGLIPMVTVDPGELDVLRSTMRDLQLDVSRYYSETGHFGTEDEAGTRVRDFLGHAQQMNDLLSNSIADRARTRHCSAALLGILSAHSSAGCGMPGTSYSTCCTS